MDRCGWWRRRPWWMARSMRLRARPGATVFDRWGRSANPPLRLPDPVALLAQRDSQFHFHLHRRLVRHGVVDGIEIRQQPHAVVANEGVRLDARLVLVEA